LKSACGLKVDSKELEDFELDVVEAVDLSKLSQMDDSVTFE